jgi:hypothetical protein
MKQLIIVAALPFLWSAGAYAQAERNVPGTYTIASIYDQAPDGAKRDTWGHGVAGQLILTPEGRFSTVLLSDPREKSDKGARVPVGPYLSYYGTYTIEDGAKTLVYHVENASFPNWKGITRRVRIADAGASELKIVSTVSGDPVLGNFEAYQTWKRVTK